MVPESGRPALFVAFLMRMDSEKSLLSGVLLIEGFVRGWRELDAVLTGAKARDALRERFKEAGFHLGGLFRCDCWSMGKSPASIDVASSRV